MVELQDCQQWEMEGKLQFHSHLMLIAQFWFLAGFSSAWAQSHSRVQFLGTTWYATHQVPLSMGFSRQEYWSRLPCPPPGDLPHSGIEPASPALQADSLLLNLRGSPSKDAYVLIFNTLLFFPRSEKCQPEAWELLLPCEPRAKLRGHICMCACVCVCVKERERERETLSSSQGLSDTKEAVGSRPIVENGKGLTWSQT